MKFCIKVVEYNDGEKRYIPCRLLFGFFPRPFYDEYECPINYRKWEYAMARIQKYKDQQRKSVTYKAVE